MKTEIVKRQIRAAAFEYAFGGVRDVEILANRVGLSSRTLWRVIKPGHRFYNLWREELAALGYEGEACFRVRPRRQADPEKKARAREGWLSLRQKYPVLSRRSMAHRLAAEVDATPGAVTGWIRGFEKEMEEESHE